MPIVTLDDENQRLIYEEIDKVLPDDGQWHYITVHSTYQKFRAKDGELVRFILARVIDKPTLGEHITILRDAIEKFFKRIGLSRTDDLINEHISEESFLNGFGKIADKLSELDDVLKDFTDFYTAAPNLEGRRDKNEY